MERLGLYCVPYRALDIVADLGFDLVQDYAHGWWTSTGEITAYFDKCATLGLKVLWSLPLSLVRETPEPEMLRRALGQLRVLKDHPALDAWYLLDEPETVSSGDRDQLLTTSRNWAHSLKTLAPDVPTVTATCSWYRHLGSYPWPGDRLLCSTYAVRQYWPFGAYQLPAIWAGLALLYPGHLVPIIQRHDADLYWGHPYRAPNEYEMAWMCTCAKRFNEVWFWPGVVNDVLPGHDPLMIRPDYDVTRSGEQAAFRRWLRYLGR